MSIAIVAAGFTGDEANQLRRAMATFRHVELFTNWKTRWWKAWFAEAMKGISLKTASTRSKDLASMVFLKAMLRVLPSWSIFHLRLSVIIPLLSRRHC